MLLILLDLALVAIMATASFQAGKAVGLIEAIKQDKRDNKR